MSRLQISPLSPPDESGQALKGRIASNLSRNRFNKNTPLRGMGVIGYDNKLFQ